MNIQRLEELATFLNMNMDAFTYYSRLGFANALGSFEIDDDAWVECEHEREEFGNLLTEDLQGEDFYNVFYIIHLKNLKIEKFIKF